MQAATGSQLSVFKGGVACVNLDGLKTRCPPVFWTTGIVLKAQGAKQQGISDKTV